MSGDNYEFCVSLCSSFCLCLSFFWGCLCVFPGHHHLKQEQRANCTCDRLAMDISFECFEFNVVSVFVFVCVCVYFLWAKSELHGWRSGDQRLWVGSGAQTADNGIWLPLTTAGPVPPIFKFPLFNYFSFLCQQDILWNVQALPKAKQTQELPACNKSTAFKTRQTFGQDLLPATTLDWTWQWGNTFIQK